MIPSSLKCIGLIAASVVGLLVTTLRAEPVVSGDRAIAILRQAWKERLSDKIGKNGHFALLKEQIFDPKQVQARQIPSTDALERVNSTLSADEKKLLIVHGDIKSLEREQKLWAVTNPGDFGCGFEAYIDPQTGALLFLWVIPEG